MKILIANIFIAIIIVLPFRSNAQSVLYPSYKLNGLSDIETADTLGIFPSHIDSFLVTAVSDSIVQSFRNKGFLSASLDEVKIIGSTVHYDLWIGRKYSLNDLIIEANDLLLLEGTGFRKIDWSKRILNKTTIDDLKNKVLVQLADNGYPFASVYLDSISIEGRNISSKLKIDKNDLITYDSLTILGNASINKSFLHKFLQVKKGDPYRQKNILNLKKKIQSTSFLSFKSDPTLSFVNGKAYLNLPLINKNASKFDFIIGVLPQNLNGVRSFSITGDFTGEFVNKLGNGEALSVQIRRLRPETSNLDLRFNYPYFLNLPFGINGNFSIYRNTTNFINLNANFGVDYQLSRNDRLKIGWNFESSRLVEIDTSALLAQKKLPSRLDISITSGDIVLNLDRLNYRFNPSAGWNLLLRVNAGQKSIKPNATIQSLANENVDFSAAYDSLSLKSFQAEVNFEIDYYIDVKNWATVRIANRSSLKYNEETVYENEFFRIGGNKRLRGFNEETILTPAYTVFTAEFRILLDQLSYISLPFIDVARTRVTDLNGNLFWDNAFGAGIGLNFGTPAGIFNISFAAGKRLESGFNFNETKIHFGYVNLF